MIKHLEFEFLLNAIVWNDPLSHIDGKFLNDVSDVTEAAVRVEVKDVVQALSAVVVLQFEIETFRVHHSERLVVKESSIFDDDFVADFALDIILDGLQHVKTCQSRPALDWVGINLQVFQIHKLLYVGRNVRSIFLDLELHEIDVSPILIFLNIEKVVFVDALTHIYIELPQLLSLTYKTVQLTLFRKLSNQTEPNFVHIFQVMLFLILEQIDEIASIAIA